MVNKRDRMERMKWCTQCDTWKSHWTRVSKKCKDCVEKNYFMSKKASKNGGGGGGQHYKRLKKLAEIVAEEKKDGKKSVLEI